MATQTLLPVRSLRGAAKYPTVQDHFGFDPQRISRDQADAHFLTSGADGAVAARCSVWADSLPDLDGQKTGAIGHFAATNSLAAISVLRAARNELKRLGCKTVVGPIDGTTWRPYRLVTRAGQLPPFFLEPENPATWPRYFEAAGFAPIARYVSEINDDIVSNRPGTGSLRAQFAQRGISIRALKPDAAEQALNEIYDIAVASFQEAFLYTPLDREAFLSIYRSLLPRLSPELVLIARHAERPVGFVFAIPDWRQAQDASSIDTIVIKTIAILPQPAYRGLGRVLIDSLLDNAQELGYRRAISALMHVANRSQKISADCAGPMREYTLYGMEIER